MSLTSRTTTFQGHPLTLLGHEVKTGIKAPDFTVLTNDLKEKTLNDFSGKTLLLITVPSLDTGVCDMETRKFNEKAANLDPNIEVLVVSMDLPFAQSRWCGAAGIHKVKTCSDHRDASLGMAYGILIKELRLLARAVFIIDPQGMINYIQLVEEMTHEPDYEAVMNALKKIKG